MPFGFKNDIGTRTSHHLIFVSKHPLGYPVIFLDALMVKMRHEGRVENRAVYVAIGIDLEGQKDVLGLWTSANEGSKFWLQVLTDLKNRGIQDVFIACVDGLKGFPQAIETVFPQAQVQLCIVHLTRASLNYVSWKERKAVAAGSEDHLSSRHRRSSRTGAPGLRCQVGRALSNDRCAVDPQLAARHPVF